WWSFPGHLLTTSTSLQGNLHAWHLPVWALAAVMIAGGTVVPFFLLISALRHLPATRVGIVAMLEPVVGAIVGWAWLSEARGGRLARPDEPGARPPRPRAARARLAPPGCSPRAQPRDARLQRLRAWRLREPDGPLRRHRQARRREPCLVHRDARLGPRHR